MEEERSYHNGLTDATMNSLQAGLARIENKIDAWDGLCEARRGNLHERINSLYKWMIGSAITLGIALFGIFLKLFVR
jgi:hypothetical protein